MAQNVIINSVTYSNVPEVDIPKSGGGTAKFYDTASADFEAGHLLTGKSAYGASGSVNGSMANNGSTSGEISTKAGTVSIPSGYTSGGTVSIKSSAVTDLTSANLLSGKTVSLASSTNWQNYDLLLVDISVDTTTNGRHTSTVTPVLLTGTSNVTTKNTYTVGSNKWNSKLGSTGTASTRQSTSAYGVYINAASVSSNTLNMTVYYRYNSNNTGTINGTYTARVYGLKLYDLIGG